MWFVMNNIDLHSIEWELIMFINIRVLRLHITVWKSSLTVNELLIAYLNEEEFIMVIELRVVQFGLKSYARFQN